MYCAQQVERSSGPCVRLARSLAYVLMHDLLVSSRWLDSRQPRVQLLLAYQPQLKAAYSMSAGSREKAHDASHYLIFARVNTLRCTREAAVNELLSQGWEELEPLHGDATASPLARASGSRVFSRDAVLHDVLAFPPGGGELRRLLLLREGHLLLQAACTRGPLACAHNAVLVLAYRAPHLTRRTERAAWLLTCCHLQRALL